MKTIFLILDFMAKNCPNYIIVPAQVGGNVALKGYRAVTATWR